MTHFFLSIIVPTSSGRIPWSLLQSIKEQSLDSNQYEVILVFNKISPQKKSVSWSNVKVFDSPFPGVNHARNLGIIHAKGDILLFLDDDCLLHNSHYLEQLLRFHGQYPQQKTIGGPYSLSRISSAAGRAYHHNQSAWIKSHLANDPRHSQVMLGGNASYKKEIFAEGLRFPPGIIYGGSETPLNLEIYQNYGPHLFLDELSVEHQSRLTVISFLRKAYWQGKGWAFQKKFHARLDSSPKTVLKPHDFYIKILLYFYNFFFMVGYRTSIFERTFWLQSFIEEALRRLLHPLRIILREVKLAQIVLKRTFESQKSVPSRKNKISVSEHESLFEKLKNLSYTDFESCSFALDAKIQPDAIFQNLVEITDFYSIPSSPLSFAEQPPSTHQLIIHQVPRGFVVFDPNFSDNYKQWTLQRMEMSKIKTSVYYLSDKDSVLTKKIWHHSKDKTFFALDNVFIETCIWEDYIQKVRHIGNHFSWNNFVVNSSISAAYDTAKKGMPLKSESLSWHAKLYFLNTPQCAFYQKNFVLLGNSISYRSFLLKFLSFIYEIGSLFPRKWTILLQNLRSRATNQISYLNVEVQENWFLIHKIAISSLYRIFWQIHTFISPTIGFLRSLFQEPKEFSELPFAQKYKQRLALFARKWGWLILRGVRLR